MSSWHGNSLSKITNLALSALVLVAAVSGCTSAPMLRDEAVDGPKRTIVYAARDTKAGSVFGPDALMEKRLAARKIPQGAVDSSEELAGQRPKFDLEAGTLVTWQAILSQDPVLGTAIRAGHDIAAGQEIAQTDIVEDGSVPIVEMPQGTARAASEVLKRKTNVPIKTKDLILLQDLEGTAPPSELQSKGTVVRVKKDVKAGTTLTEQDVEEIEVFAADIPQDALSSSSMAVDHSLKYDLKTNDLVCHHDL